MLGDQHQEEPRNEARERARKILPRYSQGPLVRVGTARHQAEAEMLEGLLLEEGIPSLVRRSGGFDVPDFLAAGPRDILVPESGVELAREILGTRDAGTRGRAARRGVRHARVGQGACGGAGGRHPCADRRGCVRGGVLGPGQLRLGREAVNRPV